MDIFLKLLAVVLAGCLAGLFLRGSDFRLITALCGLVLGCILLMQLLKPVLELLQELVETAGISAAVFTPVLKAAAIGILTQTVGSVCADAGEHALASCWNLAEHWQSSTCRCLCFPRYCPCCGR